MNLVSILYIEHNSKIFENFRYDPSVPVNLTSHPAKQNVNALKLKKLLKNVILSGGNSNS